MRLVRALAFCGIFGALAAVTPAVIITDTTDANALIAEALGFTAPGVTITGATYNGATVAAGTYTNLMFAPLSGISSGFLLTSGDAQIAMGPNNDDSAGISNGGPVQYFANYDGINSQTLNDVATLTVNFNVAADTTLAFDFSFGSDEYYYYTNSPFNDTFLAFLDGGTTTLALDPLGHAITVDNQYLIIDNRPSSFSPTNGYGLPDKAGSGTAAGIQELQYDGFTPVLRTSFFVPAGSHSLTFIVGDGSDTVLDSGVFISHILEPGKGNGTGPVEPGPAAAVAFGVALLSRLRRSRA